MIFALVLSLILLFAFGTVIVIFGDSPALRNTQLFHVRQYLVTGLDGVASRYSGFNQRHFNGRLTFALGYLVPAIHMAIVTFCVQQFVSKTIPILQRFTTPNYFYISISIALIYISTYLATFTSAGEIGSAQFPYIPNNQLIFFDKKVCQTCNIIKPARSKHCSVCNGCFALYDHHCIWVNNCIGYSNYKWFMLYLLSNINFLGYGAVICFEALNYQIKSEYKEYGFWTIITSTTEANKVTGVFVILTSIFVVIVVLFLALQLKYVYLGVTTNEADKWSAVEFLVSIGALYKLVNEGEELYLEKAKTRDGEILYITLQDEQIVNVDESQLVKINSVEDDLINIYDHGFWDNFKERIFTR